MDISNYTIYFVMETKIQEQQPLFYTRSGCNYSIIHINTRQSVSYSMEYNFYPGKAGSFYWYCFSGLTSIPEPLFRTDQ